jgi:hypothetical protein
MATIDIVKSIVEEVNIHNCGIASFKDFFNVKEAVYKYMTRTWNFCKNDNDDNLTKDEFLKCCKSYDSERRPNYGNLDLKKNIKKIKVGDMLTSRYKVLEIDLENSYLLCEDVIYRSYNVHYYIENIDATPTLYSDYRSTYAYGDSYEY